MHLRIWEDKNEKKSEPSTEKQKGREEQSSYAYVHSLTSLREAIVEVGVLKTMHVTSTGASFYTIQMITL